MYRKKCLIISCFLLLISVLSTAQIYQSLESNFLADTLWKADIPIKVEQFVELRKYVLTNQQNNRYQFFKEFEPLLVAKIRELDSLYRLEIDEFVDWITERSINRIPVGYSYISSKLEFEKLLHLPKCYAILLNPKRKDIIKKLSPERFLYANNLVEEIFLIIEKDDKISALEKETKRYRSEVKAFESHLFKGSISNDMQMKCSLIDYLMLASRAK